MHHRRYYAAPRPLDPRQRRLVVRAAVALLAILLLGIAREDIMAPPPAVAVPSTAACAAQGVELAICVDVTRASGDWRH